MHVGNVAISLAAFGMHAVFFTCTCMSLIHYVIAGMPAISILSRLGNISFGEDRPPTSCLASVDLCKQD